MTMELPEMLEIIRSKAEEHPEYINVILTDLNSMINKYHPEIREGKKDLLPLVSDSFKPRVKIVKERIFNTIGQKIKIPELRFEADRISADAGIPLPNSTRKNNEALMQWFDTNWDIIEPLLKEHPPSLTPKK